jgi:Fic family protein
MFSAGCPPDVPTFSTELEGNTLALREVEMLLVQGRVMGAKPLKEYNEVKGYADAARWVYGQAREPGDWPGGKLLTMSEVRHVHHLAMTPVWDVAPPPDVNDREGPGSFREHHIHPFSAGMMPPAWPLVPARMQQWVEDICVTLVRIGPGAVNRLTRELARCHNEFEQVHPFIDGNGRTGRLVMNLALVRLGYPPVIIFKRQRAAYLAAMQCADGGDYGALADLIARAMNDNLNPFIAPDVASPARMVPLAVLADEEFTTIALTRAAQRGKLDAVQGPDGTWWSSRRAVDACLGARHQRWPENTAPS